MMKISVFLIFCFSLQLFAANSYSQSARLTLHMDNVKIKDVLMQIENQSEFYFLYNGKLVDVDKTVSINVNNQQITDVLTQLFANKDVAVKVVDRQIVLLPSSMQTDFNNLSAIQGISITGTIKDNAGEPMPGVNVTVKGTITGTVTDMNGKYTITAPNREAVLVFSFVGYVKQEIMVDDRLEISITLIEDTQQLEEVVVVGYGSQAKRNLTGAVSNIKSEAITRSNATMVSQSLAGKIQGISTRATDARPGRGIGLQIRNMGSPLYVIDGIPYGGNTSRTVYSTPQVSGEDIFNAISIEDIESISFLKDASAAVYGLRASNGVVLVTTKKGRKDETVQINVNGYYGWQNFTRYPQPANAGQYVRASVESEQNQGRNPALLYTSEELAKWEAGTDPDHKSYNYYDIVMRPNVPQYYINANATGGTKRSNYYMSLSHNQQDAIIKDYSWSKTNLQANLETNLVQGLTIGTQISGILDMTHNIGVPGTDDFGRPLNSVMRMWPIESPWANDNPNYINQTHIMDHNPASYSRDITGWVEIAQKRANVNLYAQYEFKFGLSIKGTYSYNYENLLTDGQEKSYPAYKYNKETGEYETQPNWGNQSPWRGQEKRDVISTYAQIQVNYKKTFGDHNIAAMAAYEQSDYDNTYSYTQANPTNNYIPIIQLSEITQLNNTWAYEARAGYIGRINYDYKSRYLLELLGRYDGSFLYAPGKRWGFFPGVSAGWRISDESFFKGLSNIVNDLKIRFSYGQTGSESGVSMHGFLGGYNFNQGSSIFDSKYVIGLRPRGLPITNLSWVTNTSTDIGLDMAFLDRRLTVTADIFQRKRTGLPAARYDVVLPEEVGYTLPNENLNSDVQRGIEGIVSYSSSAGELNYSLSANATFSRLRSLETYKPRFSSSWNEYRNSSEDRWSGVTWGYQLAGRFQTIDEINNHPVNIDGQGNRTLLPGDLIYKDLNGDDIINSLDQRPIGYTTGATPFLTFGFSASFEWKGLDLSLDFAGGAMQSLLRSDQLKIPFINDGNSPEFLFTDRWHQEDPYNNNSPWISGYYPAIRKGNTSHSNFWTSDFWLTNVRYLRLKNVELGYSLPENITSKVKISKLRVYVNISNLFSLDNVRKYQIDPEIATSGGMVYPQQRLVMLGANLSF